MAPGAIASGEAVRSLARRPSGVLAINYHLSAIDSPLVQSESMGRARRRMDRHLRAASTSQNHTGMVATVSTPRPSTFMMSLKDEQQTLVELMGNNQPDDIDQPRHSGPKPRSELRNRYRIV